MRDRGRSSLVVYGVAGAGAAPDGGAAGGVGDIHSVAEQLGDQTCVGGLGAACAGAGELEQRLLELAALDGRFADSTSASARRWRPCSRTPAADRAGSPAEPWSMRSFPWSGRRLTQSAAAHAVQRGDSHGELILALALAGLDRTDLRSLRERQRPLPRSVRTDGSWHAGRQRRSCCTGCTCRRPTRGRSRRRRASRKRKRPARTVPST